MSRPGDGPAPAGLMRRFSACAEAIASTSSKLEKTRLLAAYLGSLDAERLPVAARFFAGGLLPAGEGGALMVGGAALAQVIRDLAGCDDTALGAAWQRHADVGDVTLELLTAAGHGGGDIDILDVAAGFAELASTAGSRARTAALRAQLARCSPLDAKYVVKLISGDMRIGLRQGLVEGAVALAFDRPAAEVTRADLVTGDLGLVAVLARDDRLAEAAPRLFAPVRFMLATPAADAAEVVARMGEDVWVEDKYDGIRCQLHSDATRVALFSRDLHDVTAQFPEVEAAAAAVADEIILDGELLALRDGTVLPFSDLQTRLGRRDPPPALLERVPVTFVAWDVLWHGGASLLDAPLRDRRRRLEALRLGPGFALAHQERISGAAAVDRLFAEARARLNEGLMVKAPESPYTPGRRGLAWLKLKRPLDTLDVVVTGAEWGHGKRRDVLSDVTFSVLDEASGELVPVGKAYTGLTDAEIARMTAMLLETTVSVHGRYRVVEPRIVLEIAFDRVQPSARHRSGYALRFPRIARWRHDRDPAGVDTLGRVRAIAEALLHGRVQRVDPT